METVLKALESMGKASSIELAGRLGMERQLVIDKLEMYTVDYMLYTFF